MNTNYSTSSSIATRDNENPGGGDWNLEKFDAHDMQSESLDEDFAECLPNVEEYKAQQQGNKPNIGVFGDIEDPIHDQLPSIDDIKAHVKPKPKRDRKRCLLIATAVVLPVVAASVLVGAGILIGRDRNNVDESFLNPSAAPPPNQPSSMSRVYEVVDFIVAQGWSEKDVIMDPKQGQWKAAVFLADFDEQKLAVADTVDFRQRYALATLYFATSGRDWLYQLNWLSGDDVCDWKQTFQGVDVSSIDAGLSCDCTTSGQECDRNTVKKIFLPSMGLAGVIPPEIRLLTDLEEFDVYANGLEGTFPDEMKALSKLRYLVTYDNMLDGPIPDWLGVMPNLSTLNLASNTFNGTIPESFVGNDVLTNLNLNDNNLEGSLENLAGMTKLQALFLDLNSFTGVLDASLLQSFKSLQILDVSENEFEGPLPSNIFQLQNLLILDLHDNLFTGPLPNVNNDLRLFYLALHKNELSGMVGSGLWRMRQLTHLDLSNNEFTGPMPTEIEYMENLEYLFLANNAFDDGPIPSYLGALPNLVDLSLQSTNRIGSIPQSISNLGNLVLMDFSRNKLTGGIPEGIGMMDSLRFLLLNRNFLQGTIPLTFSNLRQLTVFLIDNNDDGIYGDANVICDIDSGLLSTFIADCSTTNGDLDCRCCTECCNGSGDSCNDEIWFADIDPVWQTKYVRDEYTVREDDIKYPDVDHPDDGGSQAAVDTDLPLPSDLPWDGDLHADPEIDPTGDQTPEDVPEGYTSGSRPYNADPEDAQSDTSPSGSTSPGSGSSSYPGTSGSGGTSGNGAASGSTTGDDDGPPPQYTGGPAGLSGNTGSNSASGGNGGGADDSP